MIWLQEVRHLDHQPRLLALLAVDPGSVAFSTPMTTVQVEHPQATMMKTIKTRNSLQEERRGKFHAVCGMIYTETGLADSSTNALESGSRSSRL